MSEHNNSMISQFSYNVPIVGDKKNLFESSINNNYLPQNVPSFNSPNM